jgi:citrate synthase
MSDDFGQTIQTKIWSEEPEPDNPFVAASCRCYGYDVFGDLLGKASYLEYLYLLFKGHRPTTAQAKFLQVIAIALANPGPRDPSVHAAMGVGTTGGHAAAALIAALSVGAGSYTGAREIFIAMEYWESRGNDLAVWCQLLSSPPTPTRKTVWVERESPAGFDEYGKSCAQPVRQTLTMLTEIMPGHNTEWLMRHQTELEKAVGHPLAMNGVIAAGFCDLGFTATEGEMLTLLLRLPGAAVHALEQLQRGFRQFPFFELDILNDPKFHPNQEPS